MKFIVVVDLLAIHLGLLGERKAKKWDAGQKPLTCFVRRVSLIEVEVC